MSNDSNVEFSALLRALHSHYSELRKVLQSESLDIHEKIVEVRRHLANAKSVEAKLAPLRRRYQDEGLNLDSEASRLNAETAKVLEGILPLLEAMSQKAKSSVQGLFPNLRDNLRASEMKQAYAGRAKLPNRTPSIHQ